MSWAGDWMCGVCQHMNFKKRDECQQCGFSKYGGQMDASVYGYNTVANTNNRAEVLAGDWYCRALNCEAHNYASRTSCFRCGAQKTAHASDYYASTTTMASGGYRSEAALPGWKTGDWICTRPGCGSYTIMLVGWNATSATCEGTLARNLPPRLAKFTKTKAKCCKKRTVTNPSIFKHH